MKQDNDLVPVNDFVDQQLSAEQKDLSSDTPNVRDDYHVKSKNRTLSEILDG